MCVCVYVCVQWIDIKKALMPNRLAKIYCHFLKLKLFRMPHVYSVLFSEVYYKAYCQKVIWWFSRPTKILTRSVNSIFQPPLPLWCMKLIYIYIYWVWHKTAFDGVVPFLEFEECRVPFHYHYSQVHVDSEWWYLLGYYLWIKLNSSTFYLL